MLESEQLGQPKEPKQRKQAKRKVAKAKRPRDFNFTRMLFLSPV
jgi:hypothetical protein